METPPQERKTQAISLKETHSEMPDKLDLETERRLTQLEMNMQHNRKLIDEARDAQVKLTQRVDAIDKRMIALCALAGGGGSAIVQLVLQTLHAIK